MFDSANTPAEMSKEVIDGINAAIQRLRAMKVVAVPVAGPRDNVWYRNLAKIYTQAHIRRILTCLDAGHAEFIAGRYLITDMCSRAIFETVAVFLDFVRQLYRLLDTNDIAKIEEFLRARILATRVAEFTQGDGAISATNILNQIDKLTKDIPTARQAYDHLSDIVHPNVLGLVVYFGALNPRDGTITFPEETSSKERARDSFAVAAVLILHFDCAIKELELRLNKLVGETSA